MAEDVLRLAASGARIGQIAEMLSITEREAADRLAAAVARAVELAPDEAGRREVELTHLDMLRAALTPAALRGDISAARILVRIHQSRAILLGLATAPEEPADLEEGVNDLARIRERRAERRAPSAL